MKARREYIALAGIFLVVLLFRLYFAFQTQYFSSDAYFDYRQVENIQNTFLPIFKDPLNFSQIFFMPVFHYILAAFTFIAPLSIVLKVVPNIFASFLVIIVYFIALKTTNHKGAALFSAFVAGFIPIFVNKTLNSISIFSFTIPLTFFLIYCFMNIPKKKFILLFIAGTLFLTFTHTTALLLVLALMLYLVLVKIEGIKTDRTEFELILFSALLSLWLTFLVFKQPLLVHGLAVFWQNMPESILVSFFKEFNILTAIYMIGIIPFLAGFYVIYLYILREKDKHIYLFTSFALSILLLLWLKVIRMDIGLMFLGVILVLLFSRFYQLFFVYLKKTKVSKYSSLFVVLFVVLFILLSVVPSADYAQKAVNKAPSEYEIQALEWLSMNSEEDEIILSSPDYGFLISTIAKRKNIVSSNFLLADDSEQLYSDVRTIYTTSSEIEAINLLNKYNTDYMLLTTKILSDYNIEGFSYVDDKNCFELVFDNKDAQIYKSLCQVEVK
ncbi:MAG: hypothetical protein GY861_08570 [bacterium]|nr:hypothetical protein [bacterium]